MTLSAAEWLTLQRSTLARRITDLQYERIPALSERFGPAGRAKCEQDAAYHLEYLAVAVGGGSALFCDYIGWAKALLVSLGIGASHLQTNLECIGEAINEAAPNDAIRAALSRPLDEALAAFAQMPDEVPSLIRPDAPHSGLARRYLDSMLAGERQTAMQLIVDAAGDGVPVKELYLNVFTPVQRELGRMWQHNLISVAEEHYCTAITQLTISRLYSYIFSSERNARTLVATCVSGDLHELGVRMVADFFEMDGWDTYYLGSNVPPVSVVKAIRDRSADVVAISATITPHAAAVAELIALIRATDDVKGVTVLVGGYPFNVDPELWKRVGADGHATDAQQAVLMANAASDQA